MKYFFLILLFLGCRYPQKEFKEKTLIVEAKQTVPVSELGISIHNEGCGREWVSEEGKPAMERAFCEVTVKTTDSVYHFSNTNKPLFIKNIRLDLEKMNPWGRVEDSIPPGGCRIRVTKLPDTSR